jgi:hypothetical protein
MARPSTTSLAAGLVAGAALFAHALVQNSQAWPLLWPLLGGLTAVLLGRRGITSFGAAVRAGALTGLIAGLVFFAVTAIALLILEVPTEAAQAVEGRSGPFLVGLAITSVLAAIVGAVGGAAGWAIAKRRR